MNFVHVRRVCAVCWLAVFCACLCFGLGFESRSLNVVFAVLDCLLLVCSVLQWILGVASIMSHALGLAPFKDNFWTTVKQPGSNGF